MKLLFVTQAIDTEDPVLSFAHSWVRELSQHFESIEVICLKRGAYSLPSNVRVYSLGKPSFAEASEGTGRSFSRLRYVIRFFLYIWKLRAQYDVVLVHQNQEYVLLAGWLWELWRKRVYMWRNHYAGSFLTIFAAFFCKKVFSTSEYSYTARLSKNVQMPVGVDTTIFRPNFSLQKRNSLLFLGRIAPSKRIEVILEALSILKSKGIELEADIFGDPLPQHASYRNELQGFVEKHGISHVKFFSGVKNEAAPALFASHEIFVNCSESGMYDKTIFESLASGALTFAASRDYAQLVDSRLTFGGTPEGLADAIETVLSLPEEKKEHLKREGLQVAQDHSLESLARRLKEEMSA